MAGLVATGCGPAAYLGRMTIVVDADDNTVLASHCGIHTRGCVIVGDAGKLITTIGVSNLLIIQDGDATLVADRREEGTVKALVELMKMKGLESYL